MEGILGRRTMKKILFMLLCISTNFCIAQEVSCRIPAAASNCNQSGTLTSVVGCWVVNVAGTTHYVPYF